MGSILYLLVGTYTLGASEGIYLYKFDTLTGNSEYVTMVKAQNPSYLEVTKDGKYIYAVAESGDVSSANAISFDKATEKLELLNSEPTNGAGPCNIEIDPEGTFVLTTNYKGGSLSAFAIQKDHTLSPVRQVIQFEGKGTDASRQNQPHLHCVLSSPDGKYIFATDLGTDHIYRFQPARDGSEDILNRRTMKTFKVPDGSGPRHITFHPSGKFLYLINELSGTVIGFRYNDGDISAFQTIEADTLRAKGSADIGITPNGQYLYASNRLRGDGIAIFSIDPQSGTLTRAGYQPTGIHPRNFTITPNGKYLLSASRDSNLIEVFEIDYTTGLLRNIHKNITIDQPVCLKFIK